MSLLQWFNGNLKKVFSHKHPVRFVTGHSFKKVIRIISTAYPHFLDIIPIIYKKGNFSLRLAPTLLSYVMYEYPEVREDDEKFIAKILNKGEIYVDIGANVGNTTLAAACAVGETGIVYSFEAHPRTFRYLLGSIACNKDLVYRIITKNVALGEENGEVYFSDLQNDDINKVSNTGVKVKMETLDKQNLPSIKVLKIDVEGYEYFVLKGATETLKRTDVVVFESFKDNYDQFNVTTRMCIQLLESSGFKVFKKDGKQITSNYVSYECEDLIACKDFNIFP